MSADRRLSSGKQIESDDVVVGLEEVIDVTRQGDVSVRPVHFRFYSGRHGRGKFMCLQQKDPSSRRCKHVNLPDYVLISAHARELVETGGLHI